MIPGVRGRLLGAGFVRDVLPSLAPASAPPALAATLDRWWTKVDASLGPASSIRAVTDIAVIPLLEALDITVATRVPLEQACLLHTSCGEASGPDVLVLGWRQPLAHGWRTLISPANTGGCSWVLCTNGADVRLLDRRKIWSREHVEFDLAIAARENITSALLWTVTRADALTGRAPLLDRLVEQSALYGADICRSLGAGVLDAFTTLHGALSRQRRPQLTPAKEPAPAPHGTETVTLSIIVLYRVLFLLFAEARGLVPMWHPVYRSRYSLDALVTSLLDGRNVPGMWPAVQAISRLACAGCRAGDLAVNAFNGSLFSLADTARLEAAPVSDDTLGHVITAVATRPVRRPHSHPGAPAGRQRIYFRDLDVEQLGTVYEQLLEYQPGRRDNTLTRTRDVRKASATFYTPRAITDFVVRETLTPLVRGRTADEILALRVLDPAMGSGAFLVAACRYLATAAEDALIREGRWHPGDITVADRLALKRDIALRCLYGVDINPVAVQLARLSIWLATLAADKPLSFLDHHLVCGNSLVGATIAHVQSQRPAVAGRARRHRPRALPLFPEDELPLALASAVRVRLDLSSRPDESVAIVREKERALARLRDAGTLTRWCRLLDLWCATWFWPVEDGIDAGTFGDLCASVLRDGGTLPAATTSAWLERAAAAAGEHAFLHWPMAFPEVFSHAGGAALDRPGFDAVVGNPPWDMVRGDSGEGGIRDSRRRQARQLSAFVRESGVYRVESRAHVNRYQLFVERALQLTRRGGRLGLVLPAGIVSDSGAAALRRHLFERADVESITVLTNRARVFPIHRSVRFALVSGSAGSPTTAISCRFGVSQPSQLDHLRTPRLHVTRRLLSRLSGDDDLGIPEVAGETDLRIVERISATVPRLGSADGWHAAFGRELNASDDRRLFRQATGTPGARPVVEGKFIDSFRVALDRCRYELAFPAAVDDRLPRIDRIAYRDVASATNRLTLIAAIVPAAAVTTHTAFCLKTRMPADAQHALCALLNSFVANYLVRLRVNTHVTASLLSRLPVPPIGPGDPALVTLAALARAVATSHLPVPAMPAYAELQAVCARLYGIDADEFAHVLGTFPLVDPATRGDALARFRRLSA